MVYFSRGTLPQKRVKGHNQKENHNLLGLRSENQNQKKLKTGSNPLGKPPFLGWLTLKGHPSELFSTCCRGFLLMAAFTRQRTSRDSGSRGPSDQSNGKGVGWGGCGGVVGVGAVGEGGWGGWDGGGEGWRQLASAVKEMVA